MKKLGNKWMQCVTCGKEIVCDEYGMSEDQPLYLRPVGGYSDMYDNYADSEDEERNLIIFCHKCGHRIIRLMGKGVLNYINPLGTTCHVRPHKNTKGRSDVYGWWHFGWDNVTLRGYISAAWHMFRINGFKGVRFAFDYLFDEQNYSKLNKSINDPYPTNFKIGCIRIPKWYGIRITDNIRRRCI